MDRRTQSPGCETTSNAGTSGGCPARRADAIVTYLRGFEPPFNPENVVEMIAEALTAHRITSVTGDRYAAEWVSSAFEKNGISFLPSTKPRSDLYLTLESYINTNRIQYPADKRLIRELSNLERRRGRRGRDIIDHPPRGSDDYANSVAGICHVLMNTELIFSDMRGVY